MLASGQTARFFAGKFVLCLVLFSKEFVCGQLSTTMVLLNLSRHIQSKVYLLKPQCNRVEIIFTFWFVSFIQAAVTNYWRQLLEDRTVRFWVTKYLENIAKGMEYFDSFNTFCLKQRLQQGLKSSAWFCLAKSGKYIELHTLTSPCNNLNKVATLANPYNKLKKSMYQDWKIHVTT